MLRSFIALILLCLTSANYAAEVNNLYQAQAPVSSRDDAERSALSSPLLQQVLLKVVGNAALLNSVDLEPLLAQAESMVQQYEYLRTNMLSDDLTRPDELALKLRFDSAAVNQAIQQLQLPVWGKNRPDILVWAVVEQDGVSSLMGLESSPLGVFEPFNAASDSRGLPVLMPLMDLTDQIALSVDDVAKGNQSVIQTASERYQPDIILTAKITKTLNEADIDWHAIVDGESQAWHSEGALNEALTQGVGHLADKLALRFTQLVDTSQPSQRLSLQVSNVLSYADFSRVMQYLEQLDLVTDIRVSNLSEQQLDLDIGFHGSETVLERMLTVGSLLVADDSFDGSDARHYRLIP